MTPIEEMAMHDAILDGLTASEAYDVERQMTSSLLALCHAQQVEIARLKSNYAAAREDLRRFTAAAVLA